MATFKLVNTTTPAQLVGKHLIHNCRTKETFAADTAAEAKTLADQHQADTVTYYANGGK